LLDELSEANVPERLVYALYNWRGLLLIWDHLNSMETDLQKT
jgi:hypothetical protein